MFKSKDINYGRVRRTNQKQKHILFAAMAVNRHVLVHHAGHPPMRRLRKDSWKQLVAQLNSVGHAKDVSQWRKCWTDLRLGMRKKYERAQQNQHTLTEYERRVIHACGMVDDEDGKNPEDINSFIKFLEQERFCEENREESEIFHEEITSDPKSTSSYFEPESKSCEPHSFIKQEFDEKSTEEFRESSVDISCDDAAMDEHILPCESKKLLQPEDPIESEALTLPASFLEVNEIRSPHQHEYESFSTKSESNRSQESNLQSATLTEIRKMHRNLLKESKKQTALLRKLICVLEK